MPLLNMMRIMAPMMLRITYVCSVALAWHARWVAEELQQT
jgi:hypothetical protein